MKTILFDKLMHFDSNSSHSPRLRCSHGTECTASADKNGSPMEISTCEQTRSALYDHIMWLANFKTLQLLHLAVNEPPISQALTTQLNSRSLQCSTCYFSHIRCEPNTDIL